MSTTILTPEQIETLFREHDDLYAFGYAIEQAVLQSPEIQAWKRDAERYRWLRDDGDGFTIDVREEGDEGENWVTGYPPDDLDAAVDAAMEKKP